MVVPISSVYTVSGALEHSSSGVLLDIDGKPQLHKDHVLNAACFPKSVTASESDEFLSRVKNALFVNALSWNQLFASITATYIFNFYEMTDKVSIYLSGNQYAEMWGSCPFVDA